MKKMFCAFFVLATFTWARSVVHPPVPELPPRANLYTAIFNAAPQTSLEVTPLLILIPHVGRSDPLDLNFSLDERGRSGLKK
jgi:hypothetical protein